MIINYYRFTISGGPDNVHGEAGLVKVPGGTRGGTRGLRSPADRALRRERKWHALGLTLNGVFRDLSYMILVE